MAQAESSSSVDHDYDTGRKILSATSKAEDITACALMSNTVKSMSQTESLSTAGGDYVPGEEALDEYDSGEEAVLPITVPAAIRHWSR